MSTTLNRPDAYHPEVVKLLVRQSGPAQVPHHMLDLEDVIDLQGSTEGRSGDKGPGQTVFQSQSAFIIPSGRVQLRYTYVDTHLSCRLPPLQAHPPVVMRLDVTRLEVLRPGPVVVRGAEKVLISLRPKLAVQSAKVFP